jgi:hypothetical protein
MKVENSRYPLKRFIKSRLPMVAKAAREVRVLIKSDRSVYGSEPFTRLNADALFSDYVFEKHNFDPRLHADKKRYLLTDVDVSDPVILGNCTRIGSIDEVPDNDIAGSLFYSTSRSIPMRIRTSGRSSTEAGCSSHRSARAAHPTASPTRTPGRPSGRPGPTKRVSRHGDQCAGKHLRSARSHPTP